MILHDYKFEDLASAPIKQTDVVVAKQIQDTYGYYDDTVIWDSSDILMSVNIDSIGAFLGTATKKATVKLLGIVETATAGDVFQVRLGIYDTDIAVLAFNYISQGFFVVDEVAFDYEAGSTTITMYDHMWTAQNTSYKATADTSGFSFPATVQEFAEQMAAAIGVELMPGFGSLPNSDYSILVDPYISISNATIQTAIQEIAATTATSAHMTDTTLVFSPFALTREVVS